MNMRRAKKKHYKQKIAISYKKIWDLEFLKDKYKAMREELRNEHDKMAEQVDAAKLRLEEEKKKEDPDKTIMKNLQNLQDKYKPDLENFVKQMKALDEQIDGDNGINDSIEGYQTVVKMLKERMKNL